MILASWQIWPLADGNSKSSGNAPSPDGDPGVVVVEVFDVAVPSSGGLGEGPRPFPLTLDGLVDGTVFAPVSLLPAGRGVGSDFGGGAAKAG